LCAADRRKSHRLHGDIEPGKCIAIDRDVQLKSHIQLVASLHARLRGDFEESFVTPSRANLTLPQTVQFQLWLTFVMLFGGPNALTPEAARSPCGGTLDGFPTNSRQALQGCIAVSKELFRGIDGPCRVLVGPLDRPALRRLDGIRAGGIVADTVRMLHLDSAANHRGAPVDLRAGVLAATFTKLPRIDVETLAVELHGRLQKVALFIVALDKLHLPRRVLTYVHQLVPVVADATDEEKSFLVDLGLNLIEGEPRIAVSTGPHRGLRRYPGGILACNT
jgi:hypothetical protein